MVTVMWIGPDKSGQVRAGVKYYFSSTVSPALFKFGPPPKGVNCNFSLPEFDKLYGVGKLSISDPYICSFSRIDQKIINYSFFNFFA